MKYKWAALFLALIVLALGALVSCNQPAYRTAELFPVQPGDSWVMENKFGDKTYYDIEAAPTSAGCETGSNFIMHVAKSAARTYWGDGIEGAEDREVFHRDANGEIRGVADIPLFSQGCPWCNGATKETINWRPVSGEPPPYVVIPASTWTGHLLKMLTHYQGYMAPDINTTDCIAQPENYFIEMPWESDFYLADVETPAYSGLAMVNEQFEGAVHEKWYFAPGIGLVQVDSYLVGGDPAMMVALQAEYGTDVITIKRQP
jgi:hypothetical protein